MAAVMQRSTQYSLDTDSSGASVVGSILILRVKAGPSVNQHQSIVQIFHQQYCNMYAQYLLPFLAAMAMASPVALNETEVVKRDQVNLCQDSSFINKLSNRSPLIEDCRQIQRNIANGGDWGVSCAGHRFSEPTVSYGSCAFGAECKTDTWSGIRIGNQDIIDLINDSIRQFGYADRVGGEGYVDCQQAGLPSGRTLGIKWAVYNTADAQKN